jgi:hypothetical protein
VDGNGIGPASSPRLLQIGPKWPGHLPVENIEMMRRDSAERFSRDAKIERGVLGPRMREPVGDQQRVELRRFPVVELRAVIADTFQRVRHMPESGAKSIDYRTKTTKLRGRLAFNQTREDLSSVCPTSECGAYATKRTSEGASPLRVGFPSEQT